MLNTYYLTQYLVYIIEVNAQHIVIKNIDKTNRLEPNVNQNKDSGENWLSYSPRKNHSGIKTKINTACYSNKLDKINNYCSIA